MLTDDVPPVNRTGRRDPSAPRRTLDQGAPEPLQVTVREGEPGWTVSNYAITIQLSVPENDLISVRSAVILPGFLARAWRQN